MDRATLAFYEKNAPRFSMSSAEGPSKYLDGFLDQLPEGARILELGCGVGRDSVRILERGFVLDATDGSPAMVRKANERFDIGARIMRFDELHTSAEYDALWAHACLLHVARTDLPNILKAIHSALRPAGLHFANYKLGDGEGRCNLGRLHNFPDREWIEAAYRKADFQLRKTEIYRGEGADGTMRHWIALTAEKS